jgi:chain length determinant protein (polysaccharide antigen chain regulator)
VKQKWLILFSTVLCTLLALTYFFIQRSTYIAEASVIAPYKSDVAPLNVHPILFVGLPAEKEFSIIDIYTIFHNALKSDNVKKRFFEEVYFPLLSSKERKISKNKLYKDYLNSLTIKDENRITYKSNLAFKTTDAAQAQKILNAYIVFVNKKALFLLTNELNKRKNNVISVLTQQISMLHAVESANKIEEQKQFERVLAQAKKQGINTLLFSPRTISETTLQIYKEKLKRFKESNTTINSIKMFRLDDSIHISSTHKAIGFNQLLLLGLFGGMILGCMAASLRQGLLTKN